MYLIRRTFKTKPREAPKVAALVHAQAQLYHEQGHRGEFTVAFNGGTLPGDSNVVILEWVQDEIMAPSRGDTDISSEIYEAGAKYREFVESNSIEFLELLSPDKLEKYKKLL